MAKKLGTAQKKKKLWRIFSQYILLRDSRDGFGQCIACGKTVPYPNSTGAFHASHYFPRSTTYAALYFDEMNVHACCINCNLYLSGNIAKFRVGIIKRYGQAVLDDLESRADDPYDPNFKFTYDEKIDYYKGLVKEMKAKGMR